MDILAAIRREEQKIEKQLSKLQGQLDNIRAAAKSLGGPGNHSGAGMRKRVLSAAGRARIAAAAKRRWAKVRARAKKTQAKA